MGDMGGAKFGGCVVQHPMRAQLGFAAALSALLLSSACVIIVRPDNNGNTPTPVPVPTPLGCQQNPETPRAHIFFSTRLDRSTVILAAEYEAFMQDIVVGLGAAGVQTTHGVMVRADERPSDPIMLAAWGCRLDNPQTLTPQSVIETYARNTPAPGVLGCVTDPLVDLGGDLQSALTQYPVELPGTSGLSVFGEAPDVALVVHLDHLARRTAADEPGCSRLKDLSQADDGLSVAFNYPSGALRPDQVVHWMAVTPEGVSRSEFVADCQKLEGFPSTTLDVLEPSERFVYEPLSQNLQDSGHRVRSLSFCRVLSNPRDFIVREVMKIAQDLGLDPDEEVVRTAIETGTTIPPPDEIMFPDSVDIGD